MPFRRWREGAVAFLDICTVYYMVERGFNPSRLTGGGGKNCPHLRLTCITFLFFAIEQIFFVTFPKYDCFTECTYFRYLGDNAS